MTKQILLVTGLLFLAPITEGYSIKQKKPRRAARWYNYRIPKRDISMKDGTLLFVQYTSINGELHMDDVQRWEIMSQAFAVLSEQEIADQLAYFGYYKK